MDDKIRGKPLRLTKSERISKQHYSERGSKSFKSTRFYPKSIFIYILGGVVFLLLLSYIVRLGLYGSVSVPSFTSFLSNVVAAPVFKPNFSLIPVSLGDWSVYISLFDIKLSFNFLRDFFVSIISVYNFFLFLGQNILLIFEYLFFFTRWLFGF